MPRRTRFGIALAGLALVTLLAALWAWPLLAQKGSTEAPPVSAASLVHLTTPEGGTDAFIAKPSGSGPAPAVIMVHEWWGLNDQIRDMARRMAQQGYYTIVPDLYHGKVASTPDDAHELMRGLEDTRVFSELDAAGAWLHSQKRCENSRVAVMGFCVGGGITLRYALRTPTLAAAVMFYGPPETDPEKLAMLQAPLQGHFGADDQGITPERVEAFRAALKQAGKSADLYVYSGAGHAFMHDGAASYRADAAKIAWARTLS
ncbi:MAG: dienelactone hydrolase family protein, partial [Candidatus Eiseniibacteriota bacterium]